MVQRFFLDRIDLQRGGMSVSEAVKLAALIRADKTEPRLPFPDMAVPRTQVTVHLTFVLRLPPTRFVEYRRVLKGCDVAHDETPQKLHYTPVPERERQGRWAPRAAARQMNLHHKRVA